MISNERFIFAVQGMVGAILAHRLISTDKIQLLFYIIENAY
jgi:hypothetical protein